MLIWKTGRKKVSLPHGLAVLELKMPYIGEVWLVFDLVHTVVSATEHEIQVMFFMRSHKDIADVLGRYPHVGLIIKEKYLRASMGEREAVFSGFYLGDHSSVPPHLYYTANNEPRH